jgi:PIN domain nuclease of toxin-antitoxin system
MEASQSLKLSAAAGQAIANEREIGVAVISCWEAAMLVGQKPAKIGLTVSKKVENSACI